VNNGCGTIGGRNGCGSIPPPDGGYSGSGDGTEIARITEDELSMIVGCSLREHHSPNICTDWEVGECEEYDPIITGNEGDKLVLVADCKWKPGDDKKEKECRDYLRKVADRWTDLGLLYTYTVKGGGIVDPEQGTEFPCFGASSASCAYGRWLNPLMRGVVVVFVKNNPQCPGGVPLQAGGGGGRGPCDRSTNPPCIYCSAQPCAPTFHGANRCPPLWFFPYPSERDMCDLSFDAAAISDLCDVAYPACLVSCGVYVLGSVDYEACLKCCEQALPDCYTMALDGHC